MRLATLGSLRSFSRSARARVGALLAFFLAITIVTQVYFRSSINELHASLLAVVNTAEVIHQAENFHSAAHMMLLLALDRSGFGDSLRAGDYEAQRDEARTILKTLMAETTWHAGHGATGGGASDLSDLSGGFERFTGLTDALITEVGVPSANESVKVEKAFGVLFSTYLQVLHRFHGDRFEQVRNEAHNILKRTDLTFALQLGLIALAGAAALLISNRAIVRPFAAAESGATRDMLTGLSNRRYLDEIATEDVARAIARKEPVAIALMDIDHFKRLNDSYGHLAGDETLRSIARLIHNEVRGGDAVIRYGGEEFLIILEGATKTAAAAVIEKLRSSIENLKIEVSGIETILRVTASFGLAEQPTDGMSLQELIRTADGRLYHAKNTGRNRVVAE